MFKRSSVVMPEAARTDEGSAPGSVVRPEMGVSESWIGKIGKALLRVVFWPYRRGSWQYDILAAVILVFIFLTPRAWLGDRPAQPVNSRSRAAGPGIARILSAEGVLLYHVDVGLLRPESSREAMSGPTLNLSNLSAALQKTLLQKTLEDRLGMPVAVKSFAPVKNAEGVVLGYDVLVESAEQ